jgi:hypothetical protein
MNAVKKRALCESVLKHWMDNLFLAHAGELNIYDISAGNCGFCYHFHVRISSSPCPGCPLLLVGPWCSNMASAWGDVFCELKRAMICGYGGGLVGVVERMITTIEKASDLWCGYESEGY